MESYTAKAPQMYAEIKRCCAPPLFFFLYLTISHNAKSSSWSWWKPEVFTMVSNVLYPLLPHTFHNPFAPESCTPFASITMALDRTSQAPLTVRALHRFSIPSLELKVKMPPNVDFLLCHCNVLHGKFYI